MSLTLRPMRLSDISQVTAIERRAFSSPWTARTYTYEITESEYSHMMALTLPNTAPRNDMISRMAACGISTTRRTSAPSPVTPITAARGMAKSRWSG